jgi:hypothetical protein
MKGVDPKASVPDLSQGFYEPKEEMARLTEIWTSCLGHSHLTVPP